ncbi:MAG: DUF1003 domain-containing protein [Chloroflexota bacterium]|nr:DUF1003 domain-containing protein [Chloroflexota bacterium]
MNELEQVAKESSDSNTDFDKKTKEQVDPIGQNIETIANLHIHMEKKVDWHQRSIESVTAFLGRPSFLYIILTFVAIWILINVALILSGFHPIDLPPFNLLQGIIGLSALLMTTIVLITQQRQNRVTELRRQLDLQVNLLVEQKVTKLIALVEELRRDIPDVQDRHDPEVEALMEPVNPHEVVTTLNQMIKEAAMEVEKE